MKKAEVKLPPRFLKMNSLPDDPPFSEPYGYETPGAGCFLLISSVPQSWIVTYDKPWIELADIREHLKENQGIIEVDVGRTNAGRRFLYSIVKTIHQQEGARYFLRMYVEYEGFSMQILGSFNERGTTGVRDALVLSVLEEKGDVQVTEEGISGWSEDPFDPEFIYGIPMNRSEKKEYDKRFPQHPLSQLRKFVGEVAKLN